MVILQAPDKMAKCARFFEQCLDFLDEPNHLVLKLFEYISAKIVLFLNFLFDTSSVSYCT